MPSRPSHPDIVPGMGMGTQPGVHSRTTPHDMPYSQPYMRWMGYGGVQDPKFTLTGPPPPMARDDRTHSYLQGIPRPPMQGGYGLRMSMNSFRGDGRMGDARHLDMIGAERMHGVVPYPSLDVSRSHSADGDVVGRRHGPGFKGLLVLLRGLPGSGKTTLAR